MNLVAVNLNGDPVLGPEEVDLITAPGNLRWDPGVHPRTRKTRFAGEAQQRFLVVISRQGRAHIVNGDDSAKSWCPSMAPRMSQRVPYSPQVEDPEQFSLIRHAFEAPVIKDGAQIQKRAGHRGAGDPILLCVVLGSKHPRPVNPQTSPPATRAVGDCHVNLAVSLSAQSEERGCVSVRKQCAQSTSENRSHPPAFLCESSVADRVHPSVDSMQSPGLAAFFDRSRRKTKLP